MIETEALKHFLGPSAGSATFAAFGGGCGCGTEDSGLQSTGVAIAADVWAIEQSVLAHFLVDEVHRAHDPCQGCNKEYETVLMFAADSFGGGPFSLPRFGRHGRGTQRRGGDGGGLGGYFGKIFGPNEEDDPCDKLQGRIDGAKDEVNEIVNRLKNYTETLGGDTPGILGHDGAFDELFWGVWFPRLMELDNQIEILEGQKDEDCP